MDNQEKEPKTDQPPKEVAPTGVVTASASDNDGINGPFPPELNHWNWGAFFLHWIWGVANNVYIALVILVLGWLPFVSLGMMIYLGIKGNELAWKNRKFASIDEFKAVQQAWTRWGVGLFFAGVALTLLSLIMAIVLGWHYSKPTLSDGITTNPAANGIVSPNPVPTSTFPF